MLRKILVVDDSPLIHQMYAIYLRQYHGTVVVTATNGAEALATLAREPEVDLILLDINMPVMNGMEVLARLRKNAALARIPVIVITTHGDQVDAEQCRALGAKGYLTKPF